MGRLCGLAVLAVAMVVLASAACDKLKSLEIPGIVSGQVLNQAGQGQGFLSIRLFDAATGKESYRDTTDDLGNFMIDKVSAGKYQIRIYGMGDKEMATDAKDVQMRPGKTLQLTITLVPAQT